MNKVEVISREVDRSRCGGSRRSAARRRKRRNCCFPSGATIYVRQFLECGLPTMLAPGNVPAVAAALPTEFIILTSADDEAFIRRAPCLQASFPRSARSTIHLDRSSDHRWQLFDDNHARLYRGGARSRRRRWSTPASSSWCRTTSSPTARLRNALKRMLRRRQRRRGRQLPGRA